MNYDTEILMTSSAEAEKGIKLFKVAEKTKISRMPFLQCSLKPNKEAM